MARCNVGLTLIYADFPDPKTALRVRFDLESSQYATMCLRELLKEHMESATQGAMVPEGSFEHRLLYGSDSSERGEYPCNPCLL